jgi:cell division protein FtsW
MTELARQAPASEVPERGYDLILFAAVLALLSIGTIEIFATTAASSRGGGGAAHFLERQVIYMALGGVAMWIGATFDYRRLYRLTYPLLVLSLVLLAGVQAMPAINGAKRWIMLGPLSFQPVEIAKLALITYLAYSLRRKGEGIKDFTIGFVPHVVVCCAMMFLLLLQPDLGSSIILMMTTLVMLFVAGARISYILLSVLCAAPVGYYLVAGTSWRMERLMAYFNPEAYSTREAYQFLQARLAMGSGGVSGVGLGEGRQSLGYMPEAHNDFIMAPIGEELGFIGVAAVLALFAILLWRGVRAALGARDIFGGYLAFGITCMFSLQALLNTGVVLGLVPNKGITLPLVSYGGTSLIATMFLVGILLNVGRRPIFAPRDADGTVLLTQAHRKRRRVKVVV